jgi:hypothetical protein
LKCLQNMCTPASFFAWLQSFFLPATCPIEDYLREERGVKGTYSLGALSAIPSVSSSTQ